MEDLVLNMDKILVQEGSLRGLDTSLVIIKLQSEWLTVSHILKFIGIMMVEGK